MIFFKSEMPLSTLSKLHIGELKHTIIPCNGVSVKIGEPLVYMFQKGTHRPRHSVHILKDIIDFGINSLERSIKQVYGNIRPFTIVPILPKRFAYKIIEEPRICSSAPALRVYSTPPEKEFDFTLRLTFGGPIDVVYEASMNFIERPDTLHTIGDAIGHIYFNSNKIVSSCKSRAFIYDAAKDVHSPCNIILKNGSTSVIMGASSITNNGEKDHIFLSPPSMFRYLYNDRNYNSEYTSMMSFYKTLTQVKSHGMTPWKIPLDPLRELDYLYPLRVFSPTLIASYDCIDIFHIVAEKAKEAVVNGKKKLIMKMPDIC